MASSYFTSDFYFPVGSLVPEGSLLVCAREIEGQREGDGRESLNRKVEYHFPESLGVLSLSLSLTHTHTHGKPS